jgi:hypothetical protein
MASTLPHRCCTGALALLAVAPVLSAIPAAGDIPPRAPICVDAGGPDGCDPLPPPGKQQAVNQSYGMVPSPGDFDGDGLTDVAWTNVPFQAATMWWAAGSGQFTSGEAPPPPSTTDNVVGDFDGDGAVELLWYDGTLWDFSGRVPAVTAPIVPPGDHRAYVGDFDADGADDVLWFSPGETDEVWFGGSAGFTVLAVEAAGSYRPFVGDFDGDGHDDVFWNDEFGLSEVVWYGRDRAGFDPVSFAADGPFEVNVVLDWDGDGRDDIVWWWSQAPLDVMWFGRGRSFEDRNLVHFTCWPFGVDLDGDGDDELVWAIADTMGEQGDIISSYPPPGFVDTVAFDVVGQYTPLVGEFGGTPAQDVLWVNGSLVVDPVWWS